MKTTLLAGALIAAATGSLHAQTSFVSPNIGGPRGYTITTPGRPTTFVNPNLVGRGYTITTRGYRHSERCRERCRLAHRSTGAARHTPEPVWPGAQLNAKAETFDQARSNLFTTIGTSSHTMSQQTIQALPGQHPGRENPAAVPRRLAVGLAGFSVDPTLFSTERRTGIWSGEIASAAPQCGKL